MTLTPKEHAHEKIRRKKETKEKIKERAINLENERAGEEEVYWEKKLSSDKVGKYQPK